MSHDCFCSFFVSTVSLLPSCLFFCLWLSVLCFFALSNYDPVSSRKALCPSVLTSQVEILVEWQRVVWVPAPRCLWWTDRPPMCLCLVRRKQGGREWARSFCSCWLDWLCWDLLLRDISSIIYTKKQRWGSCLHVAVCMCAASTWNFLFSLISSFSSTS